LAIEVNAAITPSRPLTMSLSLICTYRRRCIEDTKIEGNSRIPKLCNLQSHMLLILKYKHRAKREAPKIYSTSIYLKLESPEDSAYLRCIHTEATHRKSAPVEPINKRQVHTIAHNNGHAASRNAVVKAARGRGVPSKVQAPLRATHFIDVHAHCETPL